MVPALHTRQLLTVASVCACVQEPATTASGTPTTVYNASTSSSSARKLLQSASNVTATFGYTTSQAVAAAFQSTFNTSQFNQALSVQGVLSLKPWNLLYSASSAFTPPASHNMGGAIKNLPSTWLPRTLNQNNVLIIVPLQAQLSLHLRHMTWTSVSPMSHCLHSQVDGLGENPRKP